MTDDEFWAVILPTISFRNSRQRQLAALTTQLRKLSTDELVEFETIYRSHLSRAYTWDLWGAAYVINGGASDDGFEYFRSWLISKGHDVYENALADADSLAGITKKEVEEGAEFEAFAYAAAKVYAEKVGDPRAEMPDEVYVTDGAAPTGTVWEEDEEKLAARYPKLWAKFGY